MRRVFKLLLWVLVLVAFLGTAAAYFRAANAPEPAAVETVSLKRGDLVSVISATGTLNSLITVQVGSQISGTIEHIYADFNQTVKKGEVIAQIEPALYQAELAQAQAKLNSAEATQDKARIDLRKAERDLRRTRDLRNKKMVSDAELDEVQSTYDGAVAEYNVRQAAVEEARAERAGAQVNLNRTTIRAPIDGIVISRDVDVGQTVAASLQAPTLFTIAQSLSRMRIDTQVDETFIGKIHVGRPVTFTVFTYPDRVFKGQIDQVRLNPVVEQDVVNYNCIIDVDNPDLALIPGMTATVAIEVARRENVLKVPHSALRFVPDLDREQLADIRKRLRHGQAALWTPRASSLTPIVVDVGLVGESETEVSGDDLEEGLAVAVPGIRKLPERRWSLRLF